ncbi:hypothetical protein P154DRAFT_567309 [Amniculicola lignicola CBS 123094]|uniref:Uncharacterized protein n=1 Tax=Amniculicola lignicola CBS 123094 TaxID=1392246 RepID=A0A6A5W2P4_9PLEO|nr:hypothetical protein P154DRAFT_567309 [Amniculicola lignicola CBS 123094]
MDVSSYRLGSTFLKYFSLSSNKAYNFGKQSFSIEAWVKTFNGGPVLARKVQAGGYNHGGFSLAVDSSQITFMNDDGSYYNVLKATNISVCDGRWHHIAAVRSGSDGYIYLDGNSLSITKEGNKDPPLNVNSTDRLTIGTVDQTVSMGNQLFTGNLAEIRLWNVARTAHDISQYMCLRLSPKDMTSSLVGYWAGEFKLVVDFSLTANALTVYGSNQGSAKCPPISGYSPNALAKIFRGIYNTAVKDSDDSTWTDESDITLTSQGFVVYGDSTVIRNVQTKGGIVSWSSDGNPFAATVELFPWSFNTLYWPDQKNRPVFEGTIQEQGSSTTKLCRGSLALIRMAYRTLLNVGTGQTVQCISPQIGSSVTIGNPSFDERDQFCRYDVGGIVHMDSGLALKPADSSTAGSKVLLTNPTLGGAHQSWSFLDDGTIVLTKSPAMALSVGDPGSDGVRPIIIDKVDSSNLKQIWLGLQNSQQIFSGLDPAAVLTDLGAKNVGVRAKADKTPGQSWYIAGRSFICASSLTALTATGKTGDALTLDSWVPGDTRQQFTCFDRGIIHEASGLVLATKGSLSIATVVLADPTVPVLAGSNEQWTIPPGSDDSSSGSDDAFSASPSLKANFAHATTRAKAVAKRSTQLAPTQLASTGQTSVLGNFVCGLTAAGLTTYVVTITTSNNLASGTNDHVKISLSNRYLKCLDPVKLETSTTHSDPFETGHSDRFVLANLEDVGQITDVTIEKTKKGWFFKDDWQITGITVTNTKWRTTSMWLPGRSGIATLDVPDKITLEMLLAPAGKFNCTMSVCMAPAQDDIGKPMGFYHTWIEVVNRTEPPVRKTYFDCAGGHEEIAGTKRDAVQGICDRNDVVKMSTGHGVDKDHPLKDKYGTNRTDGVENANVRASGWINRDGTCHQIANRYLWTCIPSTSIDDIPYEQQPNGYGWSKLIFGKYGAHFNDWLAQNGFPYVEEDDFAHFIRWWQLLGLAKDAGPAAYKLVLQLRDDLSKATNPKPDGQEVVKFMKGLRQSGRSVEDIAKLTNLTVDQVQELLGEKGRWWPLG